MKRKILIGTLLVVLVVTAGIVAADPPEKKRVIVGFEGKPNAQLVRKHGGEVTHKYSIINGVAAKIPEQAMEALRKNPNVEYVEKDQQVHILGETLLWGVDRIDAEVVHSSNTGSGVQVAVVDTGIDYTHPDLQANYLDGHDYVNGDSDPKDDNGHGTHVSGTVAAEANSEGVIGVAPETGIYALKALDKKGSGYLSDVVAGIEWAVEGPNGEEGNEDDAEVVSMSLGASSGSTSLKNAVDKALARGTLPVAAAGNDGSSSVSYPAAYSSVVAVSATDSNDDLASFSNYGEKIELAAPGVDIYSTMPTYKVYMNGRYHMSQDYDTMDGTSMACPHVSGAAALVSAELVSKGDENVAGEVRTILQDTAEDIGLDSTEQGYGLVDAEAAVNSIDGDTTASPKVNITNPTQGKEVSETVEIVADASDTDGYVKKVEFFVDGSSIANDTDGSDGWNISWDSSSVSDGDHTITAEATDNESLTSSDSVTVTTENTDNDPTVSWVNPQDGETVSGMVDIQIDASDDRDTGSDLAVNWSVNGENLRKAYYNSDSGYYEDTWNSSKVSDGDHTLNATVEDTGSNSAFEAITVTTSNTEPEGPSIDKFDVSEITSPNPHIEYEVDWAVLGTELDTVKLTLKNNDTREAYDSVTVDISGSTASGVDELKHKHAEGKGITYKIEITATETDGDTATDTWVESQQRI